jgi:hypothetical protein
MEVVGVRSRAKFRDMDVGGVQTRALELFPSGAPEIQMKFIRRPRLEPSIEQSPVMSGGAKGVPRVDADLVAARANGRTHSGKQPLGPDAIPRLHRLHRGDGDTPGRPSPPCVDRRDAPPVFFGEEDGDAVSHPHRDGHSRVVADHGVRPRAGPGSAVRGRLDDGRFMDLADKQQILRGNVETGGNRRPFIGPLPQREVFASEKVIACGEQGDALQDPSPRRLRPLERAVRLKLGHDYHWNRDRRH